VILLTECGESVFWLDDRGIFNRSVYGYRDHQQSPASGAQYSMKLPHSSLIILYVLKNMAAVNGVEAVPTVRECRDIHANHRAPVVQVC
jgi:hypothetical protein